MLKSIKVVWDIRAKDDLKLIHDFIALKSPQKAKTVVNYILLHSRDITFPEQYQIDEILGAPFRRMIVGDYKIIYKPQGDNEIRILKIFDSRQNPRKLKK